MPSSIALKGFPNRSLKTAPKFKGGSALAREFGVTATTIAEKFRRGWTADQVREFYQAQGLGKPVPKPVENTAKRSVYQGANKHAQKHDLKQSPKQSTKPALPPLPSPDPDDVDEPEVPGWIPGVVPENEFATLNHAKIRKEIALADKHELDLAERRKELIDRQKVRLYVSGMITRARDSFLRLPGELRDRLAATSNPIECEKLVRKELVHALSVLQEWKGEG